jgi:xanthine dehydrogenase iron-sulfur cluster and FAD-binding subunit A
MLSKSYTSSFRRTGWLQVHLRRHQRLLCRCTDQPPLVAKSAQEVTLNHLTAMQDPPAFTKSEIFREFRAKTFDSLSYIHARNLGPTTKSITIIDLSAYNSSA